MPQLSYAAEQPVAFAGQLSDLSPHRAVTAVNDEGVAIPFGVALTKGTGDGNYELPDASGDKVHGFAIHSHDVDQRELTGVEGIPDGARFSLLTEGCLYVLVEQAVAQGDSVFVRYSTLGNATGQLGAARKDADTLVAWAAGVKASLSCGTLSDHKFDTVVGASAAGAAGNAKKIALVYDAGAAQAGSSAYASSTLTLTFGPTSTVADMEALITAAAATSGIAVKTAGTGATVLDEASAFTAHALASGSGDYALGARVVNDTGKLYEVITAGVAAVSPATGPSGTTADITDGTVHWKYVGAATAAATAAVVKGAQYRRGAAAGGLAEVEFSKLVNLS